VASKAKAKMEKFVPPTGSFKDLLPETLKIIASSTVASDANRLLFGNDHAEFTARMNGDMQKLKQYTYTTYSARELFEHLQGERSFRIRSAD
jgi:hypothetical protein